MRERDRDRERAPQLNGHHHPTSSAGTLSPKGMLPEDAPPYVKERQGKRGEFRYF